MRTQKLAHDVGLPVGLTLTGTQVDRMDNAVRAYQAENGAIIMGTSSNFGNMFSMAAASLYLPFLPMLPTRILPNDFLYDLSQISIPSDNVDSALLHRHALL